MKISEITRESFFTWNGEGRDTTRLYDAAYKLLTDTAKKKDTFTLRILKVSLTQFLEII